MKVLLVEDNLDASTALKSLLAAKIPRVGVKTASSLKGGVEVNQDFQASVVVCDAELPDSGPFETVRSAAQLFAPSKVVIMSAHEDEELVRASFENGCHDFLIKDSSVNVPQRIIFAHLRKCLT